MSENLVLDEQRWRLALIERAIEDGALMVETRMAVQSGKLCSVAATAETMVMEGLPMFFEVQAAMFFALKLLNARATFLKAESSDPKHKARAEELEKWTVLQAQQLRDGAKIIQAAYMELLRDVAGKKPTAASEAVQ